MDLETKVGVDPSVVTPENGKTHFQVCDWNFPNFAWEEMSTALDNKRCNCRKLNPIVEQERKN